MVELARRVGFGCCAATAANGYELKCPIQHGIVTNWTDKKKITPEEHPVSLTDAFLNPQANRERMSQITFETVNVPAIYAAIRSTSISMRFGTHDRHCDDSFTAAAEEEFAREIKEKLHCFGADHDTQFKSTAEINKEEAYELPDGNINTVGAERFLLRRSVVPAVSWNPRHFFPNTKCDVDIHEEVYAKVVPLGGPVIFQGIVERMTNKLTALAPSTMRSRDVLPDGNIITVDDERFLYVEVLFQPNFIGEGSSGIHDTSLQSNMKCGVYTRKNLYAMSFVKRHHHVPRNC